MGLASARGGLVRPSSCRWGRCSLPADGVRIELTVQAPVRWPPRAGDLPCEAGQAHGGHAGPEARQAHGRLHSQPPLQLGWVTELQHHQQTAAGGEGQISPFPSPRCPSAGRRRGNGRALTTKRVVLGGEPRHCRESPGPCVRTGSPAGGACEEEATVAWGLPVDSPADFTDGMLKFGKGPPANKMWDGD